MASSVSIACPNGGLLQADNASVVYLDLALPLAPALDGSVRLGWTRAEADVGNAYFQRFGISMLLWYRPGGF
jgi:hypothetical protein